MEYHPAPHPLIARVPRKVEFVLSSDPTSFAPTQTADGQRMLPQESALGKENRPVTRPAGPMHNGEESRQDESLRTLA